MTPTLTTTWDRENLSCHQAAVTCPSLLQPEAWGILSRRYPPLSPRCVVGGERTERLKQSALKKKPPMIFLLLFSTGRQIDSKCCHISDLRGEDRCCA